MCGDGANDCVIIVLKYNFSLQFNRLKWVYNLINQMHHIQPHLLVDLILLIVLLKYYNRVRL